MKVNRYDCSRKYCIITNLDCNLNCLYCYQHKVSGHTFDVKSTLKELVPVLKEKTEKGTIIKMLGGEPFLAFPKIKHLCEEIWNMDFPESFLFHATSNGTLIHGNIQYWLKEHREQFTVKLSLDGNKQAHNTNRPNSFDKIDLAFFRDTWPDIGIKMTISPATISFLANSIIYLHEYGFKTVKPNFAELVNWNVPELYTIFFYQMIKLKDYYLSHPEVVPCKFFRIPFRRCINNTTNFHHCTLGERMVIDCHSGKYYPCVFYLPSVCGEKVSEELMKIDMTDKKNLVSDKCAECPYLNICSTCYAANYMQRGATTRRDMCICKLQKICFYVASQFMIDKYVNNKQIIPYNAKGADIYNDLLAISRLKKHIDAIPAMLNI